MLLRHADDQSRVSGLRQTMFYANNEEISEQSLFLFDCSNLTSVVWVWHNLKDVFSVLRPDYYLDEKNTRIYAEERDRSGRVVYSKLIPGEFCLYKQCKDQQG